MSAISVIRKVPRLLCWMLCAAFGLTAILTAAPTPAQAGACNWAATSDDWFLPNNWSGTTVPASGDLATIDDGGTANVALSGAVCNTLYVGAAASGSVAMTAGSLAVTNYEILATTGTGNVAQSGGTSSAYSLILGYSSGGSGIYGLSASGDLSVVRQYVGYYGNGTFTQSGGTNTITGDAAGGLALAFQPGSSGTYNLTGGTLSVSQIAPGAGNAAFNFGGGVLHASAPFSTALPMTLTGTGGNATLDTNGFVVGLSGNLTGAGGLIVQGGGALTLSGANTFSGDTSVNASTLRIASGGSLGGTGAVAVQGGSTLGGAGTISGPVHLLSGGSNPNQNGHLSPNAGAGTPTTLTIANTLALDNYSVLDYVLSNSTTGANDLTSISGANNVTLGDYGTLNVTCPSGLAVGTYKLISDPSGVISLSSGISNWAVGAHAGDTGHTYSFSLGNSNHELDFIVAGIPVNGSAKWTGGAGDGNWATSSNWTGGKIPGTTSGTSNGDTATFNSTTGANLPVVVNAARNVQSLTFDTGAGPYTISSTGGAPLLLSSGGSIQSTAGVTSTQTVNAPLAIQGASGAYGFSSNAASGTLNFLAPITGVATGGNTTTLTLGGVNTGNNTVGGAIGDGSAGGNLALVKSDSGTWMLSGANNYTGGTSVDDGLLMIENSDALPGGWPLSIGPSGSLVLGAAPVGFAVGSLSPAPIHGPAPAAIHAVPEPGTMVLLAAACGFAVLWLRRKRD